MWRHWGRRNEPQKGIKMSLKWPDYWRTKGRVQKTILHFKVLRVAVKDWGRLCPRDMLDTLDRALPHAFAKYTFGSVIMTTMATKYPQRLYNTIVENHFTTRWNSTATVLWQLPEENRTSITINYDILNYSPKVKTVHQCTLLIIVSKSLLLRKQFPVLSLQKI